MDAVAWDENKDLTVVHGARMFTRCVTWKFEFPTAGVAVVFCSEVSDGIVAQISRSEYHVIGPTQHRAIN